MSPSACEGLPRNRLYGRSGAAPFPRPPWWPPCGRTGSCTGPRHRTLPPNPAVDPSLSLSLSLLLLLSPLPGRPVAPLPRCPPGRSPGRSPTPPRAPRSAGSGRRQPCAYGPVPGSCPLPHAPRPPGPPLAARLGPLGVRPGTRVASAPAAPSAPRPFPRRPPRPPCAVRGGLHPDVPDREGEQAVPGPRKPPPPARCGGIRRRRAARCRPGQGVFPAVLAVPPGAVPLPVSAVT